MCHHLRNGNVLAAVHYLRNRNVIAAALYLRNWDVQASISPSIADEGTFVNTMKSERLEKDVALIKALIWRGKGKRKMKNVMRSKARTSSLFEKQEDGSSSLSFENQVSELKGGSGL
ncbi:hypothetical protein RchiOBHm_Chr5g0038641 [Rosa chinensis]|uniref:Uncharacterized protein n=1 Tax=Rosa chinensis TaxID=74649 RepID=A0A2P6QC16_ROSCH|nr:hypothetical protein RchiOBHm_Chr5g0038641 [Rosa chinensis]